MKRASKRYKDTVKEVESQLTACIAKGMLKNLPRSLHLLPAKNYRVTLKRFGNIAQKNYDEGKKLQTSGLSFSTLHTPW